jgi:hypothetical protein
MGSLMFLGGCATVGPRSINAGRGLYAEVINKTEDEQVLSLIVRNRYDETFGMISVASVTASLSFSVQGGVNVGIGPEDTYSNNLVPLSGGVAYEENPTISYTPLGGEDFLRKMLAPVSLSQMLLISNMVRLHPQSLEIMAGRINGLRNPFLGDDPPSPEYARMSQLYGQLRQDSALDVVVAAENEAEQFLVIHSYEDAHTDTVREFLDLLGIKKELDGSDIVLPIQAAIGTSSTAVNIQTRSPLDLIRIYGAGIDLPPPHLESGIVEPIKWQVSEERRPITIRSSQKRPDEATVSILFRDWWFYIDPTDTRSKQAFILLRTFIGMRLEDPGKARPAPVLTVPVR